MSSLLLADDVSVHFGGLRAVNGLSLAIEPGEVLGIMGPNGAGKSTLFNALTGHVSVTSGQINFLGKDVTRSSASDRARLGMARSFQLGGIIPDLTVLENVALGLDHRVRMSGIRIGRKAVIRESLERLKEWGLADLEKTLTADLSAGIRREVEIVRAVASGGRLILLDEPAAGLTGHERQQLVRFVRRFSDGGTTFLVTDHDTSVVFGISDKVLAMDLGVKIAEGPPEVVRNDAVVKEVYIGTRASGGEKAG